MIAVQDEFVNHTSSLQAYLYLQKPEIRLLQSFGPISKAHRSCSGKKQDPLRTFQDIRPSERYGGQNQEIAGAVKQERHFKLPCELIRQRKNHSHDKAVYTLPPIAVRRAEQRR